MRLLQLKDNGEFSLIEFVGDTIPRYAILSHTWGADDEELTFKDLVEGTGKSKAGYKKIRFCGIQAANDGLHFSWVDTCCIDKSSSAELSEAINSMFRWYRNAAKCYVYLSDVSTGSSVRSNLSSQSTWKPAFQHSRWFTRGWTLQELVAPTFVEFFSMEGERLGDKNSLMQEIHEITGISGQALQGSSLSQFSVDERMSWAARRKTKREEDAVYSLLGLFDIHMPLIYGEGREKALIRLQKEIKESSKEGPSTLLPTLPLNYESSPPSPSSNIPFRRDPDFIDRGPLLDHIRKKCSVPASRIALVGLGGVGKSQLAIEYCYRTKDRSPETCVFWVHASNAARLEQSYRDIADQVQLHGRKDLQANVFELVYGWLRNENNGKWLLVLDNADDAAALFSLAADSQKPQTSGDSKLARPLYTYLPQSKNGSILVTTRTKSVALKLVEESDIIPIQPMNGIAAEALLEKKLGEQVDKDYTAKLAATLEFMPLAIVQAAAYIRQRAPQCSVRQYLEDFHRSDMEKTSLLDYEAGNLRRDYEAKNSIIITWQISFDYIRRVRPTAADLLSLMSFFDRQGIPQFLLNRQLEAGDKTRNVASTVLKLLRNPHTLVRVLISSGHNEDSGNKNAISTFKDDMLTLRDYSFVTANVDGATFEMHALVQLATRKWLKEHDHLEKWRQQYIKNLYAEIPVGEHENWTKCRELFPHAKSAEVQKPTAKHSLREWASILHNAAWYALEVGKYVEAERIKGGGRRPKSWRCK
ncbi:HET-domain-containing protein [Lepidopterella palustris CBS 459.81]|uniref:HET-domain-containing protein n=1 Tax=Lepidopterella palustris CBS 459.81 TaxID=1314670 RepID=A0A8E2E302_9PEZI|nr:HET-domain-containing protein [Lepidopterella palustris CBS 459.81]